MTGIENGVSVLLRRHRTYHFKTNAGKMLFIAVLAVAVIVLVITSARRARGKELGKPAKIIILALFIAMNVGVVIIDNILAD